MIANALTETAGDDVIRSSYFMSDLDALNTAVDAKLGNGAFNQITELLNAGRYESALKIIYDGLP
jgi:hypothetical protein